MHLPRNANGTDGGCFFGSIIGCGTTTTTLPHLCTHLGRGLLQGGLPIVRALFVTTVLIVAKVVRRFARGHHVELGVRQQHRQALCTQIDA